MTGELRLNGQKYSMHDLKQHAGYVMQDDLLNGNLTVMETLNYTAQLRLPRSMPTSERSERIETVLQQMGLLKVRDVIVGSPLRKGVSGGERKRLCVAMELLTRPMLLFLDEPTSGLDSVTALSLCRRLRELADSGACTVVCTIHQPQSKIFKLFRNLILLKAGKIVYQGLSEKALHYFEGLGYPCPPHENPADYFLDCITPSAHDSMEDMAKLDAKLAEGHFNSPDVDLSAGNERPLKPRETTPWHHQFKVLFRRSVKEQVRGWPMLATQLIQTVITAVLIGTAFLQIGTSETSTVRRNSVLFFCVVNQVRLLHANKIACV